MKRKIINILIILWTIVLMKNTKASQCGAFVFGVVINNQGYSLPVISVKDNCN